MKLVLAVHPSALPGAQNLEFTTGTLKAKEPGVADTRQRGVFGYMLSCAGQPRPGRMRPS